MFYTESSACRASTLLGPVISQNIDSQKLQQQRLLHVQGQQPAGTGGLGQCGLPGAAACGVCTHAVPSNDAGETASRLAMQAAALESDDQDPLGQGRIDTTVLGLVSAAPLQRLGCNGQGLM